MTAIDVSEILKSKFIGKTLKHSVGATIQDGQIDTLAPCAPSSSCQFLREFGYGDLTFEQLQVSYGESVKSDTPTQIIPRRWILENHTDLPDKKSLTLTLSYTETVTAGVSNSITEGRSSTFNASASFDFKVYGKYSIGYSETITLSVQNSTSKSETRTSVKTENYDFGYEVPPRSAAIVDLTKELATYRTPFKAKFVVDGYFFIISTNLTKPHVSRQGIDKGWGKISNYLSESERTIEIEGHLAEIVGETTRRSIRFEPLKSDSKNLALLVDLLPISSALKPLSGFGKQSSAQITAMDISGFQSGYFEIRFDVDTHGCQNSSCAGFDATLEFQKDGELFQELYSFEGWSVADTGSATFSITRTGSRAGVLVDVLNISSPFISCDDETS